MSFIDKVIETGNNEDIEKKEDSNKEVNTNQVEEVENTEIEDINEENKEVDTQKNTQENEEVENNNIVSVFSNLLKENKVLDDDIKIENYDDLIGAFNVNKEKVVNEFINELPSDVKKLIELYGNGVNINAVKEDVLSLDKLKSISEDEKNEEVLESIFKSNLQAEGYSDEYIKRRIESAKDTDTLKLESEVAKKRMIERKEKAIEFRKQQDIENRIKQEEEYNKWIEKNKKIVNEDLTAKYGITNNIKNKVISNITEPIEVIDNRPVYYLEKALQEDDTLLAEITLLILTNKIGVNAVKSNNSNVSAGIKRLEEALGNVKQASKGDSKRPKIAKFNLSI